MSTGRGSRSAPDTPSVQKMSPRRSGTWQWPVAPGGTASRGAGDLPMATTPGCVTGLEGRGAPLGVISWQEHRSVDETSAGEELVTRATGGRVSAARCARGRTPGEATGLRPATALVSGPSRGARGGAPEPQRRGPAPSSLVGGRWLGAGQATGGGCSKRSARARGREEH